MSGSIANPDFDERRDGPGPGARVSNEHRHRLKSPKGAQQLTPEQDEKLSRSRELLVMGPHQKRIRSPIVKSKVDESAFAEEKEGCAVARSTGSKISAKTKEASLNNNKPKTNGIISNGVPTKLKEGGNSYRPIVTSKVKNPGIGREQFPSVLNPPNSSKLLNGNSSKSYTSVVVRRGVEMKRINKIVSPPQPAQPTNPKPKIANSKLKKKPADPVSGPSASNTEAVPAIEQLERSKRKAPAELASNAKLSKQKIAATSSTGPVAGPSASNTEAVLLNERKAPTELASNAKLSKQKFVTMSSTGPVAGPSASNTEAVPSKAPAELVSNPKSSKQKIVPSGTCVPNGVGKDSPDLKPKNKKDSLDEGIGTSTDPSPAKAGEKHQPYFKSQFWSFVDPKKYPPKELPSEKEEKERPYDPTEVKSYMEKQKEVRRLKEKFEREERQRQIDDKQRQLKVLESKRRELIAKSVFSPREVPAVKVPVSVAVLVPPSKGTKSQPKTKIRAPDPPSKPPIKKQVHRPSDEEARRVARVEAQADMRASMLIQEFESIVHQECLSVLKYHSEQLSQTELQTETYDKAVETTLSLFDGENNFTPFERQPKRLSKYMPPDSFEVRTAAAIKIQSAYRSYRIRRIWREVNRQREEGHRHRPKRRISFHRPRGVPLNISTPERPYGREASREDCPPRKLPAMSPAVSGVPFPFEKTAFGISLDFAPYIPPPSGFTAVSSSSSACSAASYKGPHKTSARFEEPFPKEAIKQLLSQSPAPNNRANSNTAASGSQSRLSELTGRGMTEAPLPTFSVVLREKIRLLKKHDDERKEREPKPNASEDEYESDSDATQHVSVKGKSPTVTDDYVGPDADDMRRAYATRKSIRLSLIPSLRLDSAPRSRPRKSVPDPEAETTTVDTDEELKVHESEIPFQNLPPQVQDFQRRAEEGGREVVQFAQEFQRNMAIDALRFEQRVRQKGTVPDELIQARFDQMRAQLQNISETVKEAVTGSAGPQPSVPNTILELAKCQAESLKATAEFQQWMCEMRKSELKEKEVQRDPTVDMAAVVYAVVEEAKKMGQERAEAEARERMTSFFQTSRVGQTDIGMQYPSSSESKTSTSESHSSMRAIEKGAARLRDLTQRLSSQALTQTPTPESAKEGSGPPEPDLQTSYAEDFLSSRDGEPRTEIESLKEGTSRSEPDLQTSYLEEIKSSQDDEPRTEIGSAKEGTGPPEHDLQTSYVEDFLSSQDGEPRTEIESLEEGTSRTEPDLQTSYVEEIESSKDDEPRTEIESLKEGTSRSELDHQTSCVEEIKSSQDDEPRTEIEGEDSKSDEGHDYEPDLPESTSAAKGAMLSSSFHAPITDSSKDVIAEMLQHEPTSSVGNRSYEDRTPKQEPDLQTSFVGEFESSHDDQPRTETEGEDLKPDDETEKQDPPKSTSEAEVPTPESSKKVAGGPEPDLQTTYVEDFLSSQDDEPRSELEGEDLKADEEHNYEEQDPPESTSVVKEATPLSSFDVPITGSIEEVIPGVIQHEPTSSVLSHSLEEAGRPEPDLQSGSVDQIESPQDDEPRTENEGENSKPDEDYEEQDPPESTSVGKGSTPSSSFHSPTTDSIEEVSSEVLQQEPSVRSHPYEDQTPTPESLKKGVGRSEPDLQTSYTEEFEASLDDESRTETEAEEFKPDEERDSEEQGPPESNSVSKAKSPTPTPESLKDVAGAPELDYVDKIDSSQDKEPHFETEAEGPESTSVAKAEDPTPTPESPEKLTGRSEPDLQTSCVKEIDVSQYEDTRFQIETEELKPDEEHDYEEQEWFEDELVTGPVEDENLKHEAAKIVEERRRIENEIRELEAFQAKGSPADIPSKPPPPYVSPPSQGPDSEPADFPQKTLVSCEEQKLIFLIESRVGSIWEAWRETGTYPPEPSTSLAKGATSASSFDALITDSIEEVIAEGLQHEPTSSVRSRSHEDQVRLGPLSVQAQKHRLPRSQDQLCRTVLEKMVQLVPPELLVRKANSLAGTFGFDSRKKLKWAARPRDLVDEALVEELIEEDRLWVETGPEEEQVLEHVCESVIKKAVREVVEALTGAWRKT